MTDRATPNLPSRDFSETARFYAAIGFTETWRNAGWMILVRDDLQLEFFPHPALDPATSWFSCCLRLDDLDRFYGVCTAAGLRAGGNGQPRLHVPEDVGGGRMGALIDLDGSLLRLIQT